MREQAQSEKGSEEVHEILPGSIESFSSDSTFSERYFSEELGRMITPSAPSSDSVYNEKLRKNPPVVGFDLVPHLIYFYYMRLDTDGKLRVTHYEWEPGGPIHPNDIQEKVQDFVDKIRGDRNQRPPEKGRNFDGIVWKRRSYIVFFVDELNWRLHDGGASYDGVRFVTTIPGYHGNHSFYDAVNFKVKVINDRTREESERSAIAFINHMKRSPAGDDLGRQGPPLRQEAQKFKFELLFEVEFANSGTVGMTVIFDPDGTNLGPAVAPPP